MVGGGCSVLFLPRPPPRRHSLSDHRSTMRLLSGRRLAVACAAAVGAASAAAVQWSDPSSSGVVRFGRAAVAAFSIAADYKIALYRVDPESPEYAAVSSKVHRRSAERLRDLCYRNGGCFVKVGQYLGSLDYLLPREYVQTMKVFHSEAQLTPVDQVLAIIREDLGKEVVEIFSEFDERPLGSASLAQVHRARLQADGAEVAVKVQHPNVKAHAFVDMATMEVLVKAIAWLFPEFRFMWLAEETRRNLPLELDFLHEGRNCERIGKMLSRLDFLKVPAVYWSMSSERVLTMEYCPGGKVDDRTYMESNNINPDEVADKLGRLYSAMIYEKGYVHCDPHPGNVLVARRPDCAGKVQLVLLDHGLYQALSDDFRLTYARLWLSIMKADLEDMKRCCEGLNCGNLYPLFSCMVTGRSWNAITKGVKKERFTTKEEEEIRRNAAGYFPEIVDVLNRVPRQMLLLFKTNDLLRGIETNLGCRSSAGFWRATGRSCALAVYSEEYAKANSVWRRISVFLRCSWTLFLINVQSIYFRLAGVRAS